MINLLVMVVETSGKDKLEADSGPNKNITRNNKEKEKLNELKGKNGHKVRNLK